MKIIGENADNTTLLKRVSRRTYIFHLWASASLASLVYFLIFYMLPLVQILPVWPFFYKGVFEVGLFIATLVTSAMLVGVSTQIPPIQICTEEDILFLRSLGKIVGLTCLQISSVSPSLENEPGGGTKYNTAMLLAMRNGMSKDVTIAYEVGVSNNEPFIRIFITASGRNKEQVRIILGREAMRIEAVLVASLVNVELEQLKGKALENTIIEHIPTRLYCRTSAYTTQLESSSDAYCETNNTIDSEFQVFSLQGIPRVYPSAHSSQIGTFLSTLLKQGYNASFTCVFSPSKPGKERRRMEQEWRSIREKEKKKNDSLADQSSKTELIQEYKLLKGADVWFETSAFVRTIKNNEGQLPPKEAIMGMILSIWGGDEFGAIREHQTNERLALRLLMRKHIKRKRLHVNSLAAYINTPVQQIPLVSATSLPNLPIPHKVFVDNELQIGHSVYGGRRIAPVGLKSEWLREHVAILGATGSGKTTLVKKLIAELSTKTTVTWWIFDLKGSEYADLVNIGSQEVLVLRPGLDPLITMDLIDPSVDSPHSTYTILRELIRERGATSELSPAMEKLLRARSSTG